MCFKNTERYYGGVAQLFHWVIFALFVVMFVVAEVMMGMTASPENLFVGYGKWSLYGFHKSIGMILLALVFFRVFWRFINPQPAHEENAAAWEIFAAHTNHVLLYVVMFALPISGYVMSMAGGYGITVFGVWEVPNLIGKNEAWSELAHMVHHYAKYATYILVGAHIAGVIYHHFIKKDNVLLRMLPRR